MIDWMKQYPSVWVTRIYDGDRLKAVSYIGEGNKLLYQVKNNMGFNNLGCLKMERIIKDIQTGVVLAIIKAKSIFGHDTIYTYCPPVALEGTCSITLFNIPDIIPPMKWYAPGLETFTKVDNVWIIKDPDGVVEVEGVDYIKTYYRLNVMDCNECLPLDFTLGKEMGAITASTPYRPFWYRSERDDGSLIYTYQGGMVPHYMGNEDSVPPIPPDPMNHMIYSFWGSGQAEIIRAGGDAGGNYILWKAYTEWSNVGPYAVDFTRTGLGYMLMQGFIKNQGVNLCESAGNIIKVDCCLKPEEDRPVVIHWEKCIISEWCEAPSITPVSALWYFQSWSWILMNLLAYGDGCLPYKWTVSGPGEIIGDENKKLVTYKVAAYEISDLGCYESITIAAEDRCGTSDSILFKSCCESEPSPVSIGYTSLLMSCGAQQTLTAWGGCGPYSWAVTGGGGTITQGGVYTAPATNVNCVDNPTITVTDCCGNSAQVSLAVNCWAGDYAIEHVSCNNCNTCNPAGPEWQYVDREWHRKRWDCEGALFDECDIECKPYLVHRSVCPDPPFANCDTAECGCWHPTCQDEVLYDTRTAEMKQGGCCPINPLTGLPY